MLPFILLFGVTAMKILPIAKIHGGQDGAIWNRLLFRFDSEGRCFVYDLASLQCANGGECGCMASFTLDKIETIVPHGNAVVFGNEYYQAGDEFPLLYTNVYNNYGGTDTPLKGVCLAYRLQRNGCEFSTTLVQIIEIGFTENTTYWASAGAGDVRPYGNFVIDREAGMYYAFTMRDGSRTTRYFSFALPKSTDGVIDETLAVKKVVLTVEDIGDYFDCDYHKFLQGAAFHNGKVYSLEGFTDNRENPPAMRIIDVKGHKQDTVVDLAAAGCTVEPELIDFDGDTCYYGDHLGNLYCIEF